MKNALIWTVKAYQVLLSPFLGGACRFYPSCSRYAIDVIQKYGVVRGLLKALKRLSRCHPLNPGGFDPA
jgi:hypothetical protein